MEKLTKENFWIAAMEKYPKAVDIFCDWIDGYKKEVGWDKLFPKHRDPRILGVKYHDLPAEMQLGIWIKFELEIDYGAGRCIGTDFDGDFRTHVTDFLKEIQEYFSGN